MTPKKYKLTWERYTGKSKRWLAVAVFDKGQTVSDLSEEYLELILEERENNKQESER